MTQRSEKILAVFLILFSPIVGFLLGQLLCKIPSIFFLTLDNSVENMICFVSMLSILALGILMYLSKNNKKTGEESGSEFEC